MNDLSTAVEDREAIQSKRDILRRQFEQIDRDMARAEREAEERLNNLLDIPKPEPPWLTPEEEKQLAQITKEFEAKKVQVERLADNMEAIIREMKDLQERSQQLTYERRHKSTSIDRVRFSAWVDRDLPARVRAIYNRVVVGLKN